jgi:hypothetical protein
MLCIHRVGIHFSIDQCPIDDKFDMPISYCHISTPSAVFLMHRLLSLSPVIPQVLQHILSVFVICPRSLITSFSPTLIAPLYFSLVLFYISDFSIQCQCFHIYFL